MSKYLYLFILLFISSTIEAQQNYTIRGKIINETSQVVPFASISIKGTNIACRSNEDGFFTLDGIQAFPVSINITCIGYQRQSIDLKTSKEGLIITLQTALESLKEIEITGSMRSSYVLESPVKVEVVSAKKLETFLPGPSSSIVDGIKLVSGVREVVSCGVCNTNSISINGLPGPYTAILIDGAPIYGNLASVYGLNGIPVSIIDRFEVIKGPNSTLYGSEALAGVINIITKNPSNQPILSADAMYTSQNELFHTIAGTFKGKKHATLLSLNQAFVHPIGDENEDGFNDNIQVERTSIFAKWSGIKNPQNFIAVKGIRENRWNGANAFVEYANIDAIRGSDSLYGESIYTNRLEIIGKNSINDAFQVNYSLSGHLQNSYYGDANYNANQYIGFINTTYQKALNKHDVLFGGTQRYQFYNDNTVATQKDSIDQAESQYIPGIFIQDEWRILKSVQVLIGSRLDYYNSHGLIYSPRISSKWKPYPWTTFRVNYGTGFKVVNLFTEDHAFISGQRNVVIQEKLNPEQSQSLSTNFNQVYNALGGSGSIDLDAFFTYFSNKIIPDYSELGKINYRNAAGNVISKGINLNINQQLLRYGTISIGGNLQEVTQNELSVISKVNYSADWGIIANASWDWKRTGIKIAYTLNYTGPMQLPQVFDLDVLGNPIAIARPTRSTPFGLHQIQLSKNIKNWSLYGGVQNLGDYRQSYSPLSGYNDPNYAQGFSPYFDTAYSFSPIHGREFYMGVRWNLGKK